MLDAEKVIEQPCEWPNKDNLMACAFSSHGSLFTSTDWSAYQNLYLNELMFYTLFINYYTNQILDQVTYSPIRWGNYSFTAKRQQKEVRNMLQEMQIGYEAVYQTNRMLAQVYTSFPLHIALMAYLEDLVNYRNQLTKLYTPLHQLYYLRRNAQSCQQ